MSKKKRRQFTNEQKIGSGSLVALSRRSSSTTAKRTLQSSRQGGRTPCEIGACDSTT